MKQAIKDYRPPSAPGMPVQEQPEPHQDISLQIQQFSAYQDCLRKMHDRIKHLESQLPEPASEDSKGCSAMHPSKPHEERIPPTSMGHSGVYGLLRKPINDWRHRPEAKADVGKGFVKLEKIPAWNGNDVQERSKVKGDSEKSGIPVHFAELMALCFLKNAELEKHLQKYKGRLVLRGTTSVIRMGSRRYLLSKGPEPPKWWLQSHLML